MRFRCAVSALESGVASPQPPTLYFLVGMTCSRLTQETSIVRGKAIVAALALVPIGTVDAVAQGAPPVGQQPGKPAATASIVPTPRQLAVPPAEALLMLIRSMLIALHHGNITGNYTVLRKLSAPGFQAANSAANLGQIFADLRTQRVDLTPALLLTPELVQGPAITDNGMLTMTGFLSTPQQRINFQPAFQAVDGFWRPFGIGINATPAPMEGATEPSPTAPTPAKTSAPAATPPAAKQPPGGKVKQ
jgi:hypothetical protein